jgi:hypothetical protein
MDADIAEARRLLHACSSGDLMRLAAASPPSGFWSTVLWRLIRAELLGREFTDIALLSRTVVMSGSGAG